MNIVANTVQPQGSPRGLLTRHPLLLYFILAYAGSWLLALPYIRFGHGAGLLPFRWPVPFVVSAAVIPFAGPFLAAFIVTGLTEGRAGVRRLVGRIVFWRVGLRWYLFALIGIPLITVLGAIVLPGVSGVVSSACSLVGADVFNQLCHSVLHRRTVGRRARLARFCVAPLAGALWSAGRNAHPGTASRVMAPAVLLYSGMGHRTRHDS